ncbi:hypothetical protein DIJ60_34400 [Burkholderia pseudomallei]|nr:hypothetical protein DIJ60_34400 [Burkholderia pseudomallei]
MTPRMRWIALAAATLLGAAAAGWRARPPPARDWPLYTSGPGGDRDCVRSRGPASNETKKRGAQRKTKL